MIEAVAGQSAGVYVLEVIGHAGYSAGNDVVCAAVSALVEALAAYLDEYGDAEGQAELEDGYALITVSERNAAFDMAVCGLGAIADQYPAYVSMTTTYI
ncbi:MAG: ribosomal-processing cysteine protease Prp [Clostridia bacterium]|nr:ribosomal-processing cysteine protease Prp [Clostridia bacterium]